MSDNLYQTPTAQVANAGAPVPTTLKQKLFSFDGRFSRSQYWGYAYGIPTLISLFAFIPILILMMVSEGGEPNGFLMGILGLVALAIYIPAVWIGYAGAAKRFHDRGKSGWMSLIAFIPYVGAIWILVECGCLAGTPGPNLYGPDPLQRGY